MPGAVPQCRGHGTLVFLLPGAVHGAAEQRHQVVSMCLRTRLRSALD